jgi:tol-pal system protein YbgF
MNVFHPHSVNFGSAQSFKALCLSCLVGASLMVLAVPANAQSNEIINRIDRLENEINTLNRAVYKGEMPPAGAYDAAEGTANFEVRLQQLETQLRDLTGRLEQQNYDIQQLQQRMESLQNSQKAQTSALPPPQQQQAMPSPNDYVDTPPQPLSQNDMGTAAEEMRNEDPKPPTGLHTAQPSQIKDPAGQYEQAFAYLKAGDYGAAEQGFKTFLNDNPGHALSANAIYWLGESHYVRGQFEQASKVFAEAYQKYPGGPKGADNLLKLGMSLGGMGKKKDACIALSQLSKEYPNGPGPILRRAEQEMATLDCR